MHDLLGEHRCADPAATEALGRRLGATMAPGDVVLLEGELGAGKTVLVRGLAAGLGADPAEVTSPTFVLARTHDCEGGPVQRLHHVDLYRLGHPDELRETGIEELLSDPHGVTAIEWPRHLVVPLLPHAAHVLRVMITVVDDHDARRIEIGRG